MQILSENYLKNMILQNFKVHNLNYKELKLRGLNWIRVKVDILCIIYMCICVCVCVYVYMYIYIYIFFFFFVAFLTFFP